MAHYRVYIYGSRKAFPVDGLAVGTRLPFDIFVNEENVFRKVYDAGTLFGPEERAQLRRGGFTEVYVDARETAELERYLHRTSAEVPADPADPEVCEEYVEHKTQYYQVDRSFLFPGSRVGFGVYLLGGLRLTPLVETGAEGFGVVPDGVAAAPGDVVIRNEDIALYQKYLDSLLDNGAPDAVVTPEREKIRVVVIKEKSKTIVKDLIEDPRSGENLKKATGLAAQLTDQIFADRNIVHDLISLNSYDMYTYTHSVNVAVLSVGIAITHGMEREQVRSLCTGALLHDIGKSGIPAEVLNKPGKLTPEEYAIIKGHVPEGEKILQTHEAVPQVVRDAVLQHHERLSGGGYPKGLSGDTIQLAGRISAIADCYDAMTTRRPYQLAHSPYESLSLMKKEEKNYDPEILKSFVRLLGRVGMHE